MATAIESYLCLFEDQFAGLSNEVSTDRASEVADAIDLHVVALAVLDRKIGNEGLKESHRKLVPLYARWMASARRVFAAAKSLRDAGVETNIDAIAFAINAARRMTEDFDHLVEVNSRPSPGFGGQYLSLDEFKNGLLAGNP